MKPKSRSKKQPSSNLQTENIRSWAKIARRKVKHYQSTLVKCQGDLEPIFEAVERVLPRHDFRRFMAEVGMKYDTLTGDFLLPLPVEEPHSKLTH